MKKILIINNNLHIGGVQKALANLLSCIHDQYDITLALFYPEGELLREIPDDVKILPIRSAYRFLGMTKQDVDGKLLQKIQRGFYAAICRLLGRNVAISLMALSQRKIAGFDVAISYLHDGADRMFYGGCNDFVLRHTVANKKVTFLHCDYEKCGANTTANAARYKQFDIIAACSNGCRSAFMTAVPELKTKCITVRNCQDYAEIRAAAETQPVEFPNDRINIVTVARLGREKGVGRAVEAFDQLKNLPNRFHYYILGDGIERSDIEEKIKQTGLNDRITILGEQTNPYGYMKAADLLLIPSISEAAPMVIGEAASLGTPILSTETSSAREMIETCDYGWVCKNSVEGMAESLAVLLSNTEAVIEKRKALEQMKFGNDEALAQFAELFV